MNPTISYASVDDVIRRFAEQQYICDTTIATVVYLASQLEKPILVEGPAGVGKTELAKVVAASLEPRPHPPAVLRGARRGQGALRVGVRQAAALHADPQGQDRRGDRRRDARCARRSTASPRRTTSSSPTASSCRARCCADHVRRAASVLLIDEIDKSDTEFEAFLLEVLSDFPVSVPELGTLRAKHIPIVVLTSNNAREMSDALKRRCLHLYIDFPASEQELEIVRLKVPGISDALAGRGRRGRAAHPQARPEEGAEHQRDARLGARR